MSAGPRVTMSSLKQHINIFCRPRGRLLVHVHLRMQHKITFLEQPTKKEQEQTVLFCVDSFFQHRKLMARVALDRDKQRQSAPLTTSSSLPH